MCVCVCVCTIIYKTYTKKICDWFWEKYVPNILKWSISNIHGVRFDVFFSTDLMSFVIMPIVVLLNAATEPMYKKRSR